MSFLKWIAAIAVLLWIIGLVFKIGGAFINLLLVGSGLIFIIDAIFGRRKEM